MPIDIRLATAKKNLELKSTISTYTKTENKTIDRTIEKIQFVEKFVE